MRLTCRSRRPRCAAPFFLVNDNSVSFTYFPGSTDPGIYGATYNPRYQFDLTHFDVNRWGTNFIDFNFQQYGKKDPVVSMYGAYGSQEADALVRNTLSGNAFLGKGFFSNYVTKDISLAYGGLFVVVDNLLAPQTHQYDIGVQFSLNLPGTVNFSVYAQKETHHVTQDSICPRGFSARSTRRRSAPRARPSSPARSPAIRSSSGRRASNW